MKYQVPVSYDGYISAYLRVPKIGMRYLCLMLHGGPGGTKIGPAGLFEKLETILIEANFGVCRFDFRGSGDSTGQFECSSLSSMRTDFEIVSAWARERFDVPILIIGESLGATIAIHSLSDFSAPCIFLWPAVDLRATSFRDLMTKKEITARAKLGLKKGDGLGFRFVDECMTLDLWPKIQFLEGKYLIIHGENDEEVPVSQSERLHDKLEPRSVFVCLKNVGHGAKDEKGQALVIQKVGEWIKNFGE